MNSYMITKERHEGSSSGFSFVCFVFFATKNTCGRKVEEEDKARGTR